MGFDNYAELKKYRDVLKGPEFSAKKQKLNNDSKESKSSSSKKQKVNIKEDLEDSKNFTSENLIQNLTGKSLDDSPGNS